jgi:hypothetical protein
VRSRRETEERPDAGLRRYLGVDPAVEETLARAGLFRADAHLDRKVNKKLDNDAKKTP